MMSAASLEILLSYVPDIITKRVIQEPDPLSEPTAEAIPAAVFFADISGFTALTERLARKGAVGAEELSDTLNRYFGQLVDIVRFHGGDVVKFAGDALTAIWPTNELGRSQAHFAEATIRATQCALDAQRKLKDFPTVDGQQLSLKIGLGVGDVIVPYLGGEFGRWEYLITGEPLLQVNTAEGYAAPGQIIAAPQVWALIEERFRGEHLPSAHVRIEGVSRPIRPSAAQPLMPSLETESALKNFIPGAISSRLDAGQAGWLAELRTITVVFAFLPDINHQTPLEEAQEVMLALQKALYRYEGSVNKISVDNKGAMLVAALGLPPFSHEDDAARGALAALAMLRQLKKLNRQAAIGVTTGQTFCGSMGNARRREYTMLGDVVNLSARLMQAAFSYGDALPVLCDEATYTAAQSRVEFNKLPPILVKGKEKPVMIYAPVKEKNQLIGSSAIEGMVGRRNERIAILEHLRELLDDEGSTTIIEGEAGIGKSQLIADLAKQAREVNILPLIGAGDAVEHATPYFAWRWIFRTLFDVADLGSTAVVQSKIVKQLAADNYLWQRAPLLNVVLQLGLPDTELTAQMEGEVRANNTRELLVKLLKDAVAENESEPLLIVEDVHWLDTASWAL
ncbi:MAG: adenylate/guanylate cyclase domain-containing protein, partial [Anaerolineales bacterium]|nr:adenylate/guanylate cyclase domain-containing protein [Anaerolineales bacterium]